MTDNRAVIAARSLDPEMSPCRRASAQQGSPSLACDHWALRSPTPPPPWRPARRGVPKDPFWGIAEIITNVGAVILVILMAVIHDFARPRGKILTLTTLGWTLVWTGPTGTVYFLQLTVARRIYVQAIPGLARLFGFVHAGDSRAIGRLGLIRNVAVRNWPAHAHLVVSPTTSLR